MVDLIAHRGASSEAPENTLRAIQKAADIPVDYIEIDVRLSKEGIPIVIHDPTLKRTTNCSKNLSVSKMSLDQIQTYDAGLWFSPDYKGEKIPTLKEVLELPLGSCGLMIEIKQGPYSAERIADAVLKDLSKYASPSLKYKIGSFDPSILTALKARGISSLMGLIETKRMLNRFIDFPLQHLGIWHKLLNPTVIHFLHARHIKVWSFTLDDPALIHRLLSAQLDGIITNCPRKIKKLLV